MGGTVVGPGSLTPGDRAVASSPGRELTGGAAPFPIVGGPRPERDKTIDPEVTSLFSYLTSGYNMGLLIQQE